jgi:putative PIN family toxin of toxin-antitoxin system
VRLVLDTNTVVSGLLWGGVPGKLIDAAVAGRVELSASLPLLAELRDVLDRHRLAERLVDRAVDARDLFDGYASLVKLVAPAAIGAVIVDDPDDDHVLAAAVAAAVDAIVSGDSHLLALGRFRGIPIVTATTAAKNAAG